MVIFSGRALYLPLCYRRNFLFKARRVYDLDHRTSAWIALATLTGLEIVLGVDNIIFISILCGKLPRHQQNKARIIGLALAMITRIILLSPSLAHETDQPLFTFSAMEFQEEI